MERINSSQFAGTWYPANPDVLKASMDEFVDKAIEKPYYVRGAVLPHAGHAFSGRGIAHFFRNIPRDIESVVLLCSSHYEFLVPDRFYYDLFLPL